MEVLRRFVYYGGVNLADLPKHPLAREMECCVCGVKWESVPLRRGWNPDEPLVRVVEQHVCPAGHVFQTEIGGSERVEF